MYMCNKGKPMQALPTKGNLLKEKCKVLLGEYQTVLCSVWNLNGI